MLGLLHASQAVSPEDFHPGRSRALGYHTPLGVPTIQQSAAAFYTSFLYILQFHVTAVIKPWQSQMTRLYSEV